MRFTGRKTLPDKVLEQIRKVLGLKHDQPFPRCLGKNVNKLRDFKKAGNLTHHPTGHLCPECQCSHTAGYGTQDKFGDWYGLGYPTGSYGVGFCINHTRGIRKVHAPQFAKNMLDAIRKVGISEANRMSYNQIVQYEAKEASDAIEIRNGINELNEYIQAFIVKMKETDKLQEYISIGKAGQRLAPMSDVSKANLICKLMATLSGMVKDRFTIEKDDMLHIDEIKIRIPRIISLGNRLIDKAHERGLAKDVGKDDIRTEYIEGLKDIFTTIKKG